MSNKNASPNTQQSNNRNNDKPSIYVPINNTDVRKFFKLKITPTRCYIKRGKSIKAYIQINDLFVNGEMSLETLFSRLDKVADIHGIKNLQVAPSEKIFEFISVNDFKNKGNEILNKVKVALLNEVNHIKDTKAVNDILRQYHDDPILGGHCGILRTLMKIKRHYFWKGMAKDITKYVKTCDKCQKTKITKHQKSPMTLTPTPLSAFDSVFVDTIGPLPTSINGNVYAVTIICDLTKYLVTIPIQNKNAKTVAKAIFEHFILTYGPMKTFISDMGTEYTNSILTELCELLRIDKLTSTAYRHQSIGVVERVHKVFNSYVRSYVSIDKDDWDEWLQYFTYFFNTTPSTVHNYCPYELVFGKIPNEFRQFKDIDKITPLYNIDNYAKEVKFKLEIAHRRAKIMLEQSKLKQKTNYDRNTLDYNFSIGDLVLLRNEAAHKLEPQYGGPYKIKRIDNNNHNVIIVDKKSLKEQKVHKNRLKIYQQ